MLSTETYHCELLKIKLLKLVSPRNQRRLDVKITSSKFQSRKLTMILQFYLQLGKGNFFSGRFGHSKNCFKTASYGIKWMFYPLIKLILLTDLWKPFSSHPHFPHTFSTQQWVKSAYQGVKYSLYSIRGSEENKFCCDQSRRWCWTMLGKIKKNTLLESLGESLKPCVTNYSRGEPQRKRKPRPAIGLFKLLASERGSQFVF